MKYETRCVAPSRIRAASTEQLLEMWELTEGIKPSLELATVRGWLMDELEARDLKGFNAWMDDEDSNASPRTHIKN